MKKYVLSAVVTSLFVPLAYAMDDGAAPAVDVEVPAVEIEIQQVDPLPVDVASLPPVDLTVVDSNAVDEVPVDVSVETIDAVEGAIIVDGEVAPTESELLELASQSGVAVDANGEPIVEAFDTLGGGMVRGVDDEGNPIVVCFFGGPADGEIGEVELGSGEPVEGEVVDPNLIDLASQSGTSVDENGNPVVFQSFGNLDGGELPQSAPVDGNGEVEVTAVEDAPLRSLQGEFQPNFRGGLTDRSTEALSTSEAAATSTDDSDASNPQLLNDEQRGAVRGLRTDEESAKPRSGLGKLMAKFRKPKSEVTLASAKTTNKALSAKLAEVDRMRDTALRTGDQKLLAKADKLEKELRSKSAKMTRIPTRTK